MSSSDEEWTPLGDVQYRKWKAYDVVWGESDDNEEIKDEYNEKKENLQLDLNQYIKAGCQLGGPIALLRHPNMLIEVNLRGGVANLRPNLMIFSSSGNLLVDIEWKQTTRVVDMGWTQDELLVVCLQDGNILCYDIRGVLVKTFKVGGAERTSIIGKMVVWNNGLAVLTEDMRVFVIEDLYDNNLHQRHDDHYDSLRSAIGIERNNHLNQYSNEPKIYELNTGLILTAPSSMIEQPSSNQSGILGGLTRGLSGSKNKNKNQNQNQNNQQKSSRQAICMTVLPPNRTASGMVEVLLATTDNSIIVVDKNGYEDQQLQERLNSPIVKMAVAPNGRFLACFTAEGILTVMSTTFTTKVLDFDMRTRKKPVQMLWCGDDSVLLTWKQLGIVMVGPFGHSVQFPYSELPFIVAEPDCARIFTSTTCEIFQRVPTSIESIKRIGSTDPSAMLFDASEAFEEGDPKADENIRSIQETSLLKQALSSCLEAAVSEFDIKNQQSLLRAVSYGKAFSPDFDSQEFVLICRRLRVLNHIRSFRVGLPLTWKQFNWISSEALISRIIKRKHHFLALRICDYLLIPKDKVLIQWAIDKIKSDKAQLLSSIELKDMILKKLKALPTVSYAKISKTADQIGKHELAILLLEEEKNITNQVSLLLSFQQNELALRKACQSKDSDLIYMALLHTDRAMKELNKQTYASRVLKKRRETSGNNNNKSSSSITTTSGSSSYFDDDNNEMFYSQVVRFREATNLLNIYYSSLISEEQRTDIHNFSVYSGNLMGAALAAVRQSYLQPSHKQRIVKLNEALPLLQQSKDLSFYAKMTEEQIELLSDQKGLEIRTHRNIFVDLSLSETIYNLLCLGRENKTERERMNQEALELKKKYKVPDKRFWHIKIKALSSSGQWDSLRQFAESKRSPIGYKPFAVACIKYEQPNGEIERYIERITKLEEKFDLYMQIASYPKAAEVAARMKDPQRLVEVRNSTSSHIVHRKIDQFLERLRK